MSEVLSLAGIQAGANQQNAVADALLNTSKELRTLIENRERPFIFLRSRRSGLSSNVNDDILIMPGTPVPTGFQGVIEDFNVNFSTVAGTVKLVIINKSRNIVSNILLDVSNNTSGVGAVVLDEEESLAVVGQTAGAGVFDVYCSGKIQKLVT